MMASGFNMDEFLKNTTQVSATNYHSSEEKNVALDLS